MEEQEKRIKQEQDRRNYVHRTKVGDHLENAPDTSKLRCNCNGWLNHWKNYTRKDVVKCINRSCNINAKVGAHVFLNRNKSRMFIAPFCRKCNNSHNIKQMKLDPNFPLVNADRGKLCRKQNAATRALIKKSPYLNERSKKKR